MFVQLTSIRIAWINTDMLQIIVQNDTQPHEKSSQQYISNVNFVIDWLVDERNAFRNIALSCQKQKANFVYRIFLSRRPP